MEPFNQLEGHDLTNQVDDLPYFRSGVTLVYDRETFLKSLFIIAYMKQGPSFMTWRYWETKVNEDLKTFIEETRT